MNKYIILLLIVLLPTSVLQASSLKAYMAYAIFKTPDNKPYVETYLTIKGSSVQSVLLENGMYAGIVDVQIIFRKNDTIINFDKYELAGFEVKDTSHPVKNFMDIQRYALPEGTYELELSLKDRASEEEPVISVVGFTIDFPKNEMAFSDIELLQSYEVSVDTSVIDKNGYKMMPYVFNYFPEWVTSLSFYTEFYGDEAMNGEDYLLSYYIRPFEVDKKLDQFYYRKKMKVKKISPLLKSIDISELPGGNYLLVLESRNRNNELLASKEIFFQRHNPNAAYNMTNVLLMNTSNTFVGSITNKDSLVRYIDYLFPISTEAEHHYAQSEVINGNLGDLQKYFLNFWMERDKLHPEGAWNDYHQRVIQANANFKTSARLEGYKSDRGRVYLQYGQPNVIADRHYEPASYPYEIWHYYKLPNQTDVRFVFYTHEIATNDFHLIHSTAKGELHNYRWQTLIYSRTWDPAGIDDAMIPDTWGGNATDYYLRPR